MRRISTMRRPSAAVEPRPPRRARRPRFPRTRAVRKEQRVLRDEPDAPRARAATSAARPRASVRPPSAIRALVRAGGPAIARRSDVFPLPDAPKTPSTGPSLASSTSSAKPGKRCATRPRAPSRADQRASRRRGAPRARTRRGAPRTRAPRSPRRGAAPRPRRRARSRACRPRPGSCASRPRRSRRGRSSRRTRRARARTRAPRRQRRPGSASGSVTRRNVVERPRPRLRDTLLEPRVDASDREPDRLDEEREADDRGGDHARGRGVGDVPAGQRRATPARAAGSARASQSRR